MNQGGDLQNPEADPQKGGDDSGGKEGNSHSEDLGDKVSENGKSMEWSWMRMGLILLP